MCLLTEKCSYAENDGQEEEEFESYHICGVGVLAGVTAWSMCIYIVIFAGYGWKLRESFVIYMCRPVYFRLDFHAGESLVQQCAKNFIIVLE